MTFVTVSINREQLTLLSQFLVTMFPGCTIHQSRDPMRVIRSLSHQKVDAVFADTDTCSNMLEILSRQNMNPQVCLLSSQSAVLPEEEASFDGVLSYPITEEKMRTTLQKISQNFQVALTDHAK